MTTKEKKRRNAREIAREKPKKQKKRGREKINDRERVAAAATNNER